MYMIDIHNQKRICIYSMYCTNSKTKLVFVYAA